LKVERKKRGEIETLKTVNMKAKERERARQRERERERVSE